MLSIIRYLRSELYLFEYRFYTKLKFGVNNTFSKGLFISKKNKITIGNNNYFGRNVHISSNLIIKNNVLIASNVSFVGGDHKIEGIDCLIRESGRDHFKTSVISDNVWIGHGSIIMHGVSISEGAVIAAGSVLTKNVNNNEIWGGNPAKLIRTRK